ncbi:hypothetical protein [Methylorubrum thiocyanatum]|uniref:hypothetical protein n=1 Tax=Methylorubrum thiocyanatum TaxID=47958 RepID=UPI003F7E2B83
MKRFKIDNKSKVELGLMLEPIGDRANLKPGEAIFVEGDFSEDEIVLDFHDQNFLSIWCIPSEFRKSE